MKNGKADEYDFMISNCSEVTLREVQNDLETELKKIKTRSFEVTAPGLSKVVSNYAFKYDIKKIQSNFVDKRY